MCDVFILQNVPVTQVFVTLHNVSLQIILRRWQVNEYEVEAPLEAYWQRIK